jgi:hypothetical protein
MKISIITDIYPILFTVFKPLRSNIVTKLRNFAGECGNKFMTMEL